MIDLHDPHIHFALDAVRQAARLVQQVQAEMVSPLVRAGETISPALTKDDRSPVTVADFAAQALVAHLLDGAFPGDPLVAEEDAGSLRPQAGLDPAGDGGLLQQVAGFVSRPTGESDPLVICDWIDRGAAAPAKCFWTLDPIDGTKGFLRHDQYAVALALVVDGEVQIGVLGCPKLGLVPASSGSASTNRLVPDMQASGALVIAVRGGGCWATRLDQPGEYLPLHVSDRGEASTARLLRSFESAHTNVDQIGDFARRMGIQAEPRRMDSQAKYALLACGDGDLLLRLLSPKQPDYREKIWDQAAGSLVVQEAGGRISDLSGLPLDFTSGRTLANNRGILASNAWLHPAALRALAEISA